MDKSFEPQAFEARIYQSWEAQGYFAASGQGTPFCIQLPPPNVTGTLHMGHAFQQTLMDLMVRYQRMSGADVLWQCGTDGICQPTCRIFCLFCIANLTTFPQLPSS